MIFPGNSQITGVGSFIPKQAVSSVDILEDLKTESRLGIPSTWMDDHLGIISRRYCEEDDLSSEISTIAALRALEDAGIDPKDLNAIIYCGITGDFISKGVNLTTGRGTANNGTLRSGVFEGSEFEPGGVIQLAYHFDTFDATNDGGKSSQMKGTLSSC